ncbi:MAG: lipase family protein [Hyphomicrobiales bacterium]|nr:MAG: lipase family protein [Hyphomicrobiales bacterium]
MSEIPSSGKLLVDDPALWQTEFAKRLQAYEDLLDAQRKKEKEFEEEKRLALDALRKACFDELQQPEAQLYDVAPIYPADVDALPTKRAAYSDRMAAMMAKVALLSYVAFEDSARKVILEGILTRGQVKLLQSIAVDETECIVADTTKFIVVAFRGTTSRQDVRTDLQTKLIVERVEIEGRSADVTVHYGFYLAYSKVEDQIKQQLLASGDKPIFLAGHSLGGALALVASAALAADAKLGDRIAAVYTFGAPRVGKADFADYVKAPHYRIVNQGDIVPLLPPNWILGYRHTGTPLILKPGATKPIRRRPWGSAFYYAFLSLLAWPFARGLIFRRRHDMYQYAIRLEKIARHRGKWT